jgi:hypothetical protein
MTLCSTATRSALCSALFAIFSVVGVALAPGPANAYRPFEGTDGQVSPAHNIEIELGPMGYRRSGSERFFIAPEVVLNFGVGHGFELGTEAKRIMLVSEGADDALPRIEDVAFAVKKILRAGSLQKAHGPSVATEGELHFPSTGESGVEESIALVVSGRLQQIGFHLNSEFTHTRDSELGRFGSVILEGPSAWRVRPVGELSLEREGDGTPIRSGILGIIWDTRDGLTLDAGLRIARAEEREVELRGGLTWKMPVRELLHGHVVRNMP